MALVFAPGALSRDHGPGTTFTGQESAQDARVGESPLEYPAGPKDPLRRSMEHGLDWLAGDLLEAGTVSLGNSEYRSPIGVTALAALAFMAGGSTTNRGPHQRALTVAIDYLLDHASGPEERFPGYVTAVEDLHSRTHGHGLAILAMTQAYSLSPSSPRGRRLAAAIRLGVDRIELAQGPDGGWYYSPESVDLHEGSVTVCMLQALRGARNIGFDVEREVIDSAVAYVRTLQNERGGFIYSRQQPKSSVALTAACLSTLHAIGVYEGAEVDEGYLYIWRELELREQSRVEGGFSHEAPFPFYERLYLAQALWQHQDQAVFRSWAAGESMRVVKAQLEDGSWADRRFDQRGSRVESRYGRTYSTAMNVLYLAVPEGKLPFFQR